MFWPNLQGQRIRGLMWVCEKCSGCSVELRDWERRHSLTSRASWGQEPCVVQPTQGLYSWLANHSRHRCCPVSR